MKCLQAPHCSRSSGSSARAMQRGVRTALSQPWRLQRAARSSWAVTAAADTSAADAVRDEEQQQQQQQQQMGRAEERQQQAPAPLVLDPLPPEQLQRNAALVERLRGQLILVRRLCVEGARHASAAAAMPLRRPLTPGLLRVYSPPGGCALTIRHPTHPPLSPQAPLTRANHLPFRRLCADFGAAVTYSEMAFARRECRGKEGEEGGQGSGSAGRGRLPTAAPLPPPWRRHCRRSAAQGRPQGARHAAPRRQRAAVCGAGGAAAAGARGSSLCRAGVHPALCG